MNRLLLMLLLPLVGIPNLVRACINDYSPNTAAIERSHSVIQYSQKHVLKEPWDVRRGRLRKELEVSGSYRVKNDLATTLAHTGQAAEAVALLEQVEAQKPGLYMTAANLGTAYELAGDTQKALEWIRRGIERNADAHEGTEWLHVRILEAKLAMKRDPAWLQSNSISGIVKAGGSIETSATGNRGEKLSMDQVKAALMYQLHERLQFVNPPDAIVGALLLELGDLLGKEPSGMGGAFDVFKLASDYLYGIPDLESFQATAANRSIVARLRQRTPNGWSISRYSGFIIAAGAIFAILLIALKRQIQRKWGVQKASSTH